MDPAFGERAAIGGYYPQYCLSAQLTYRELRDGTLEWISVADPSAGRVDDCVIGTPNRVEGYQVKWSLQGGTFTFRDLTSQGKDGLPSLLNQLYDGWQRLTARYPDKTVYVHLVTNAHPSSHDKLPGEQGEVLRFSGFLQEVWIPIAALVSGDLEAAAAAVAGAGVPDPEFPSPWVNGGTTLAHSQSHVILEPY